MSVGSEFTVKTTIQGLFVAGSFRFSAPAAPAAPTSHGANKIKLRFEKNWKFNNPSSPRDFHPMFDFKNVIDDTLLTSHYSRSYLIYRCPAYPRPAAAPLL